LPSLNCGIAKRNRFDPAAVAGTFADSLDGNGLAPWIAGPFVFTAEEGGSKPDGTLPPTIEGQTDQVINNIEAILGDQVKEQEKARLTMRARALEVQGRLHYGKGDLAKAERELREAAAANPALTFAPLTLARIDAKKGNDKAALTSMLSVAALSKLKPEDDAFMKELYKKVNGKDAGLDEEIDKVYRTKNPAVPTPYKKTPKRTERLVLAEMFTGSACPPCVAADLAMDAALERYPVSDLVLLAYHEHIPGPDPMVVAGASSTVTMTSRRVSSPCRTSVMRRSTRSVSPARATSSPSAAT